MSDIIHNDIRYYRMISDINHIAYNIRYDMSHIMKYDPIQYDFHSNQNLI